MQIGKLAAVAAVVMMGAAGLAGCGEAEAKKATPPPAPAGPPPPPSPDLPLDSRKARQIVGMLPTTCLRMASLKMDMVTCDERQNKPVDHEALRTELRDLAWNLQQLPVEQATERCAAMLAEMQAMPSPAACADLGY